MVIVYDNTKQGTPVQGGLSGFPWFGNVGAPLMATLNLLRFTLILPVWFFSTLNVLNALDASKTSTLYQDHQNNSNHLSSSPVNSVSPHFVSSGEGLNPSSQSSRKIIRKKNNKQGGKQPAFASHTGGKFTFSASHTGNFSPTTASHVRDMSLVVEINVGDMSLDTASHVGSIPPTTASQARARNQPLQVMPGINYQPLRKRFGERKRKG